MKTKIAPLFAMIEDANEILELAGASERVAVMICSDTDPEDSPIFKSMQEFNIYALDHYPYDAFIEALLNTKVEISKNAITSNKIRYNSIYGVSTVTLDIQILEVRYGKH